MYRMLILPSDILTLFYQGLSNEELKADFKKSALLIHPDKNHHPNAKFAFQKMFSLF